VSVAPSLSMPFAVHEHRLLGLELFGQDFSHGSTSNQGFSSAVARDLSADGFSTGSADRSNLRPGRSGVIGRNG
jgi:hypothetical protein